MKYHLGTPCRIWQLFMSSGRSRRRLFGKGVLPSVDMGCGASAGGRYRQKQMDDLLSSQQELARSNAELTAKVNEQSEQIAQLVKGQHQLVVQMSLVSEQMPPSPFGVRPSRLGTQRSLRQLADVIGEENAQQSAAVELVPAIQHYAWGKSWETSLVAKLCDTPDRHLDRTLPYAEMWMGTHPNGPSFVRLQGPDGVMHSTTSLQNIIEENPAYWLGQDSARKNLPFLLKILSVNQALSIQAHPHRKLAEYLHQTYPDMYKDCNHKPEICLPLGEFEALVAFRPFEQILGYIEHIPELQKLCGFGLCLNLKDLYSRLMRSDPAIVEVQVCSLVKRLSQEPAANLSPEEALVLRLQKEYPGDVGIFSVFFLNYVRIAEGERNRFIFCAPDEPHAYLRGDCVECMSLSDNVVRAGLTPKFKDVETLLEMMTYRDDRLETLVSEGTHIGKSLVKYDPPVEDFVVYELDGSRATATADPPLELPHASICLCTSGAFTVEFRTTTSQVEELRRGQTFFLRAGTSLFVLRAKENSKLFIATY